MSVQFLFYGSLSLRFSLSSCISCLSLSLISLTLLLSDTHWLALPLFPSLNVASSFPAAPVTSWPGGERGQKRPLVLCLEQASLPTLAHTHAHARTHSLTHTHITQGRLVRRGLPWRQDQGEKEGKQRDGWSRGEMDDSQRLIFVSKCLLAFEVVAPFFPPHPDCWRTWGQDWSAAVPPPSLPYVQTNAGLSHLRRLGIRRGNYLRNKKKGEDDWWSRWGEDSIGV